MVVCYLCPLLFGSAFVFDVPVGSGSTSGVFGVVFSDTSGGFCSGVVLTVVVVGTGVVDTKSVSQKKNIIIFSY